MINNMNDLMDMYKRMNENPVQFIGQRFNIPQGMNNPNDIIQHLLNSGQVSQTQINRVMGMRDNPIIQALMKR